MSEPTAFEFGKWFVANYPDIAASDGSWYITRSIARAAWNAANCAARELMPCDHPAACVVGSDEGKRGSSMSEQPRTFDTWIATYCGISSADPGYGIAYVAWKACERAQADIVADCQKRVSLAQARVTELEAEVTRLWSAIEGRDYATESFAERLCKLLGLDYETSWTNDIVAVIERLKAENVRLLGILASMADRVEKML